MPCGRFSARRTASARRPPARAPWRSGRLFCHCAYHASESRPGTTASASRLARRRTRNACCAAKPAQLVDHADQRDIDALPHRRQLIGKPDFRAPCGIAEAERTRNDAARNGCGDAPEQHAPAQCMHAGCSGRGDECAAKRGRDGGQHRLLLQQDDAGGERHQGERQCGHGDLRSRALVVDERSGTSRRPHTRSTTRCSDSRRTRAGAPST